MLETHRSRTTAVRLSRCLGRRVTSFGASRTDWASGWQSGSIDASLAGVASTPTCTQPRSRQAETTIDGQPAMISEGCTRQFVATVVVDARLDVFMLGHLWSDEADARALFDVFVATIDLRPEDAAVPSSTPSS